MKQNIHAPNIKDARAEFMTLRNGVAVHKQTDMFSPYSPAWLITNEDIRWVSGTTSDEAKRVLTVCGSGDHPIFYAMNGAQNVDTFDLSFCAKALMDIKTTAIQKMSYEEYVPFLYDLYYKTPDELPTLQRMLGDMPRDTAYFVKNMGNCMMFSHACNPDSYKEHLPTAREYAQIQRKIHKPFNFIWSDLCQVNTKLTGEYDVINLSNINLTPGAVIPKAVGSSGLTPLTSGADFDVSQLVLKDLRERIRHALLADRLGLLSEIKRFTRTNPTCVIGGQTGPA